MNLPNILTLFRFVLIPIFGYLMMKEGYVAAGVVFAIAGITDFLDGFIARKFKLVTDFGKIADPLADKLLQLTALTLLTYKGIIPTSFLMIVAAKEAFMGVGSILVYKKRNLVVQANWYGKLATIAFFIAILITIVLKMFFTDLETVIDVLVGAAIVITIFAMIMYIIEYAQKKVD